jgi:hypothetical protein
MKRDPARRQNVQIMTNDLERTLVGGNRFLKKVFKNLLVEKRNAYSFDICYVTLSNDPPQKLFKVYP